MLEQSVFLVQIFVSLHGSHEPPQSTSVSLPSVAPSLQLAHLPLLQLPLMQSLVTLHFSLSAHFPHEPPQSTSVSSPSTVLFLQLTQTVSAKQVSPTTAQPAFIVQALHAPAVLQ